MSSSFAALDAYLARQDDEGRVRTTRRAFALVWLVYDVVDTLTGAVEHARNWSPHPASVPLAAAHVALIVCGVQLVRDRRPYLFGLLAVSARLVESTQYGLNDFFYYAVMMLLLAHGDGGPFDANKRPLWVRHALLVELGWVYLTTSILKLSADWLSGGQLLARTTYLATALAWPYPAFVRDAFASPHTCHVLACAAVTAEFLLGLVLFARRPYALGVALVLGIHVFAMLATNVWFFSVSNIVCVALLLPRRASAPAGLA